MRFLFLLFLTVPLVEMWVLINVGQQIGAWPTIGLVVLTAAIGLQLLRQQGFSTLLRAQERMNAGGIPAQEMLEGLALAVGGALLLTPGFITDAFGFACLLPWTRRAMTARLAKRMIVAGSVHTQQTYSGQTYTGPGQNTGPQAGQSDGPVIIEGEYTDETQERR
jgi:UPF0716 protein FxsA